MAASAGSDVAVTGMRGDGIVAYLEANGIGSPGRPRRSAAIGIRLSPKRAKKEGTV